MPEGLLCQVPSVGFFQESNARVLAQSEIHLPVTRIDRNHSCRSALQQAISKASGGRANVETKLSLNVDLPMFEGTFEFESAAADVFQIFPQQTDDGILRNLCACFVDLLLVDQYFPRNDKSLGAFSRGSEGTVDEKFVQSEFQFRPGNGKLGQQFVSVRDRKIG